MFHQALVVDGSQLTDLTVRKPSIPATSFRVLRSSSEPLRLLTTCAHHDHGSMEGIVTAFAYASLLVSPEGALIVGGAVFGGVCAAFCGRDETHSKPALFHLNGINTNALSLSDLRVLNNMTAEVRSGGRAVFRNKAQKFEVEGVMVPEVGVSPVPLVRIVDGWQSVLTVGAQAASHEAIRNGRISIPLSDNVTAFGHYVIVDRLRPETSLASEYFYEMLSSSAASAWLSEVQNAAGGRDDD